MGKINENENRKVEMVCQKNIGTSGMLGIKMKNTEVYCNGVLTWYNSDRF